MAITKKGIFSFLKKKGYETKEARESMTQEQFTVMCADFNTEFGMDFTSAMNEAETATQAETERQTIIARIDSVIQNASGNGAEENETKTPAPPQATEKPIVTPQKTDRKTLLEKIDSVLLMVTDQKEKIEKLSKETETPNPKKVNAKIVAINSGMSTPKYLFGIEAPMFDRSKPWNQVAATKISLAVLGANGTGLSSNWNEYEKEFRSEVTTYGKSLANRIGQLQAENGLASLKMSEMDFTGFDGTGWGESYIVRRQDALISYLRTLPSVTSIFSVRYGVQDKEEVTNSFLADFSQAWQTGRVLKGGHSFAPMLAEVFDVMMKYKFENMKKLEREYLGYLNRENSFPIKWSMVEWLMVETLKKLLNEQNERRIQGHRVEPTAGTAGHHLFGSNGLIAQLTKYVTDGFLTREADLNTYTASTIYAYVDTFVERINQLIPSLAGYVLYINAKHIPWYLKGYEAANGTKLDYNGAKLEVKNYTLDAIVGIPNMGNNCLMFITMPGNVEFLENAAGEMAAFYFQQDLDELLTMSVWKEGITAYMVGKKNGTKKDQFIFLNDPFTALAADATTADATVNNVFKTVANTGAKALTDFVGASEGVVYKLICGATANATTVAKAAKFTNLSAAWTPTAVGDYLEVIYNATTSLFVEVSRKVS